MGVRARDGEIAGAHAHDVGREGPRQEGEAERASHRVRRGDSSGALNRERRVLTERMRGIARTGTERKLPATPATSAPPKTPRRTSSGWSCTPCPMRRTERK